MKVFFLFLSITLLMCFASAQAPLKFAFQGVARNAGGQAVANKTVSIRFTLHEGSEAGNTVFQETHQSLTNANGVFNVAVGGGTVIQGNMQSIKWGGAAYFLQAELDPSGGGAYSLISTTQLLSVPYALATRHISGSGSTNSGIGANTMGSSTKAQAQDALAIGYTTTASGVNAVSMGKLTAASGENAVSMGKLTIASGNQSLALGTNAEATGENAIAAMVNSRASNTSAVAIGQSAAASGEHSFALGWGSQASAHYGYAIGTDVTASERGAMAFGTQTTASGIYSTAMGVNVRTGGFNGAFIIGDFRGLMLNSNAENQMTMRFGGGYRFFTGSTGAGTGSGVTLAPNGNSWASISDSTKKENYRQPDGASFLSKIKSMKLGSWNYIGQDKTIYRHYGPMAQEFYSLFGNDGTGTIGNDTTIASADIDGVMMIALQALAKQVEQLTKTNKELLKRVQLLEAARKEN
ncbi:tail fiber domain-containing protein [Niabella drilacis]|uniref:Head domain of trimeric autotransporter adhesin n=1 Tax=Niabella drilacis (strain DSM 25811 / CCM 8410 / CCUG 62505 / LMG 26954 / E90) TaxID=1285928 RepID=A0A1G6SFW3_NIADE|nr:tail fiber domain-containing protein [Niabella drilacis]SDD15673.1 Head domain of trimeric autotransporter adhesin [Niabella drilacis]